MTALVEPNAASFAAATRVPTLKGWRHMSELKPGNYVFGPDGRPVKICSVKPVKEVSMRVFLSDHRCYVCSAYTQLGKACSAYKAHRRLQAIRTRATTPESLTLEPIKPVRYPRQALPIPAYLIGLLCREDTTYQSDRIIIRNIRTKSVDRLLQKQPSLCKALQYSKGELAVTSPQLVQTLSGLYHGGPEYASTYIAPQFLTACIQERCELLNGILDMAGQTMTDSVQLRHICYSMSLSIMELLVSLGIPAIAIQDRSIRIFSNDLPVSGETAKAQLKRLTLKLRPTVIRKIEPLDYTSNIRIALESGSKFLLDNYIPVSTNTVKSVNDFYSKDCGALWQRG